MIDRNTKHEYSPRIRRLVQHTDFCFPTIVQTICLRQGNFYDQEPLAQYLGVNVRLQNKAKYSLHFTALPSKDPRVGFLFSSLAEDEVREKLERLGLKFEVHYPSQIENLEAFVIENIDANKDMMMNFHWQAFRPVEGKGEGHYVLVSEYNEDDKKLTVCDPSSRNPPFWGRPLKAFERAMSPTYDGKERGLVVFEYKPDRGIITLPRIISPGKLESVVFVRNVPKSE